MRRGDQHLGNARDDTPGPPARQLLHSHRRTRSGVRHGTAPFRGSSIARGSDQVKTIFCVALVVAIGSAHAAEVTYGLAGIRQVGLVVERLNSEDEARTSVSRQSIEEAVRAAIGASRTVTIVSGPRDAPSQPALYVNFNVLPLKDSRSCVWAGRMELIQTVIPIGQSLPVFVATTWRAGGGCGICADNDLRDVVRAEVREMVDAFAAAWYKENPSPQ